MNLDQHATYDRDGLAAYNSRAYMSVAAAWSLPFMLPLAIARPGLGDWYFFAAILASALLVVWINRPLILSLRMRWVTAGAVILAQMSFLLFLVLIGFLQYGKALARPEFHQVAGYELDFAFTTSACLGVFTVPASWIAVNSWRRRSYA